MTNSTRDLLLTWLWSRVGVVYRRERPGGDTAESDKACTDVVLVLPGDLIGSQT